MFYDNFIKACIQRGISPSVAAEEMGFDRSSVTAWKRGAKPKDTTIQKVANYFGISPAELRDGPLPADQPAEAPPPVSREISGILAELTPEEREKVAAFAQGLLAARGKQPPRRP